MSVKRSDNEGPLPRVTRLRAELFGSLGGTRHGRGSGISKAVLLGLEGQRASEDGRRAAAPGAHDVRLFL